MRTAKVERTLKSALLFFGLTLVISGSADARTKLNILHTFKGSDGASPTVGSPLVFDSSGNLYGTTETGGSGFGCNGGCGTVFQLRPTSAGWIEEELYGFSDDGNAASTPEFGVTLDSSGSLYGTLSFGPTCGAIFQLVRNSVGGWTENILHVFDPDTTPGDGCDPSSALLSDSHGNLYGFTSSGGADGEGAAFELTPASGGGWTYSVIYSFGIRVGDPISPNGTMAIDATGNLYGAAAGGLYGNGNIFKLMPTSGGWTETTIYYFVDDTGTTPISGVIIDKQGNLYGATQSGGTNQGLGTVYELTPVLKGYWNIHILHTFKGNDDGAFPSYGALAVDSLGNLYGETLYGGVYGWGTAFKLLKPTSGGAWAEEILHSFSNGRDGENPSGGVVLDVMGDVYGAAGGGPANDGVIYEAVP